MLSFVFDRIHFPAVYVPPAGVIDVAETRKERLRLMQVGRNDIGVSHLIGAKGMNAAAANAQRLLADATILFEARRFPTAASLAILSIEEAGKISILRALALAGTNTEASEVWKEYRSHVRKNVLWLLPQLVAAGARKLDDFKQLMGLSVSFALSCVLAPRSDYFLSNQFTAMNTWRTLPSGSTE